jgi:hypothetical protein
MDKENVGGGGGAHTESQSSKPPVIFFKIRKVDYQLKIKRR